MTLTNLPPNQESSENLQYVENPFYYKSLFLKASTIQLKRYI